MFAASRDSASCHQQPQEQQQAVSVQDEASKRNTDCVYFLASPLTCKKDGKSHIATRPLTRCLVAQLLQKAQGTENNKNQVTKAIKTDVHETKVVEVQKKLTTHQGEAKMPFVSEVKSMHEIKILISLLIIARSKGVCEELANSNCTFIT